MKTKYLSIQSIILFCHICFFAFTIQAQEVIEVKTDHFQMSEGNQPCYKVEIPLVSLKTAEQNWVKKLQESIKAKAVEVNIEWIISDIVIKELTPDTLTIYSIFIEKDSKVFMNVFIKIDSVFFAPNNEQADLANSKIDNSIRNYIRNFALEQYKLGVNNKLVINQKILEGLEDELVKLIKTNDNLLSDNSSLENKIEKTERGIDDIDREIEIKNQQISDHKISMQASVSEEEKKAAQSKDKELAKEKNKLEKERSKNKDDISDMKSAIEKNKREIEDNNKLQETKKVEISAQKEVVAGIQLTFDNIK